VDPLVSATEIEERARLERVLTRALPTVGYHVRPETVKHLAAELRRQGCLARLPEEARARANARMKAGC
jgi:hypothetical protein